MWPVQHLSDQPTCDFPSHTLQSLNIMKCKCLVINCGLSVSPTVYLPELEQHSLDFVVDVGGTLGHYLLNYVHWGSVFARTLIMTADHAFRRPQRKNNIAAVRAVVVAADAVPLRRSQSVEGHRGWLLVIWDTATATVPPQHGQQNYDDQKKDHRAWDNPNQQSLLRATAATGVCLSCFWVCVCHEKQRTDREKDRESEMKA